VGRMGYDMGINLSGFLVNIQKIVFAVTSFLIVSNIVLAGSEIEPTEFKEAPVGTKVQFRNLSTDYTWTITTRNSEKDYQISWFSDTGDIRYAYMFCLYCSAESNKVELNEYSKLFPLEVGKKIKLQRKKKDKSKSWTHKIKVKKTEMLTTPISAVPVKAFVIEEKIRSNQGKWSGKRTFWWSPELAVVLKLVNNARGDGKKVTYELTDYILPSK